MRQRSAAVALALLAGLMWSAGPAAAQGEPLQVDETDARGHPQISMTVTAPRDLVGTALTDSAFHVNEDGAPAAVEVTALPNDDLAVLLLIDTSGSMRGDAMAAAQAAASTFIDRMPAPVQVAVIGFGTEPTLVSPFTTNSEQTIAAVANLEARGETALYDAVIASLPEFPSDPALRRAIVLLSDGGDTVSTGTLEEALNRLAGSGIGLHVVELQSPESDPDALTAIARAGEGRLASTDDPTALTSLYDDIASLLTNRYRLTYQSAAYGPTDVVVSLTHGEVAAEATLRLQLPAPPPPPPPAPPVVEEPAPRFRPGSMLHIGWIAQPWVPYAGAGTMFAATALLLLWVLSPRRSSRRLASAESRPVKFGGMIVFTERVVNLAERGLERRGRGKSLEARLEQGGMHVRPAEFVVLAACITIIVFAGLLLVSNFLLALVGGIMSAVLIRSALTLLAQRRRAAFAEQLADTLQLLAGALRTGYGLMQAIDSVAQESDSPTSEEFGRLVVETRIGRDFHSSLNAMSRRLGLEDFEWVVQAMEIHREVGGDLAEVLDAVAGTIRERDQVRRQAKALSADGRLSGIILLALPFFIAGVISVLQPGYLNPLFESRAGWIMLVVGGTLMALGAVWIRRLVRLVF